MGLFAPPDLFAAMAIAARDDADLPDGGHLRLMPSPVLGFPFAPFAIARITPFLAEPRVLWRDRSGKALTEPALDPAGGLLNADLDRPAANADTQDVAVELLTDETFQGSIILIDRAGNRELSRRSRAPFIVGGPRVDRVQITGRGKVLGLRTWRVDLQRAIEPLLGQQLTLLSLPIDGTRPWYAKGLGPAAAFDLVVRGAALRLQRPDRPDGPFDLLTPTDDQARVAAHAADLDKQCEKMVGNIAIAPRQQRLGHQKAATATAARHIVDIGIADTLFVHAMDPGLGRYLGLVGAMDEHSDGSQPVVYVAAGLFLFSTFTKAPDGRSIIASLGSRPAIMDVVEDNLLDRLSARDVLAKLIERYNAPLAVYLKNVTRLEFRGLLAVAGLVPPPDPPTLSVPTLGNAHWLDGQGRPSTTFRQDFLFPASPLGSLVALGRQENGTWTTRHRTIDLPAPAKPKRRALAMLMGRTQPTPIDLIFVTIPTDYLRRGLISDAPIPEGGATAARYRAALADLFGRFGPPAEFDVPAPARPKPPAPAPQVNLVLDGPRGVGGPPASPGHIAVVVGVPPVEHLAAGSLDIASLELSFEGGVEAPIAIAPIPPGGTRTITHTIPLRALNVAERTNGPLTARFRDSAGVLSDAADVNVSYGDGRQPNIVPTGLGIIWTSKPGPSPDVELKLTWPAAPDVRYRVYIADEKGLEVPGDSRAEIAVEGGQRDRVRALGGRERFRLLTDPPLVGVGGAVTLNEHLPRALTTVQFLRVVPLTAQGREAEFDACRVVPVAVPSDRSPPPPRVRVSVDAGTAVATVTITGLGLDLVELEASEPGLFADPPTADAVAPEFRLRRASGPVNDPVYAREIARGPLEVTREDGVVSFTRTIDDPVALGPFIRYSYWAEVRMPPERRLARVVEIPPAGGVRPVLPAQLADMPRPFSAVSAPASALHVPDAPVPTLAGAAVSVISDGVTLRASLSAPATPTSAPKAVGPYLLRIWQQWGDMPIVSAGPDVELDGSPLAWEGAPVPDDADHPQPLTLRFVVIDPVGRESEMTTIVSP